MHTTSLMRHRHAIMHAAMQESGGHAILHGMHDGSLHLKDGVSVPSHGALGHNFT